MINNTNLREHDISLIKKALSIILIVSCAIEICIYPRLTSVVLSITSLLSLCIFNRYIFRYKNIVKSPIAFLMFLNLQMFMYLPIPITLMDGEPADHDLFNPITTYILQFIYYIITAFCFVLAISRVSTYNSVLTQKLERFGFFSSPSNRFLWILGFVGILPRLMLMVSSFSFGAGFLANISYFMYAPILILFRSLFGGSPASLFQKKMVYLYFCTIIVLLIGTNARHYMITPAMILCACLFIKYFFNRYSKSFLTVRNICISIVLLLVISGPVSNIATAMVVVRSLRGDIPFEQLISETWDTANDKEAMQRYYQMQDAIEGKLLKSDWNENYVSNVFLQRFCNYRVVDASIYHADRVGWNNSEMIDEFFYTLMIAPPSPIPQLLFGYNKTENPGSQMDVLYSLSKREPVYPSLIVGGDVGLGLSVFGVFYFIIQFIVYYFLFRLINSLVYRKKNGTIVLSLFVLIQFMDYFNLFTVHSGIVRHIVFLIWGFWWGSLVLIIFYHALAKTFAERITHSNILIRK